MLCCNSIMAPPNQSEVTTSSTPSQWRSSVAFITFGTTLDTLNYSVVIAVFPFRLESLQYHNVSGLVGWLLFIYVSERLIFLRLAWAHNPALCVVRWSSTPIIAMLSERLGSRRGVMIAGQFSLLASQLLLMEANTFWLMCIGRLFEGIASSVIITVGLALICDVTPEKDIGAQAFLAAKLGIAMVGFPLGSLIGPPVGGGLYARWGYRAPFIFVVILTLFDFLGRVLITEQRAHHSSLLLDSPQGQSACEEQPAVDSPVTKSEGVISEIVPVVDQETSEQRPAKKISLLGAILRFIMSARMLVALLVGFCGTFAFSVAEVTMPLHLQAIWGLNTAKVGLVFLAAIIPTLICNKANPWHHSITLAGYLADRIGAELVAAVLLFAGIPWWAALTKQFSLVFFIVAYGIEIAPTNLYRSPDFFIAAVASPVTAEIAAITRGMEGVGYAHMYGAFNIVAGLGNAGEFNYCALTSFSCYLTCTVGSIVGGQIYAHFGAGWSIICFIDVGVLGLCLLLTVMYSGEKPLLRRCYRRMPTSDTTTALNPA
ncbi:putative MFS-type transporter C18.02 [Grifola frondosa]|uniref:Putative MFS-type transporter C18.02 n=1 Tax=Grifola frondosa TaxID=5627 RepID=A0A1C7MEA7_GRIFR|nr:putative MFS-type transporter C18.02 [Grifola frondosa]